MKKSYTMNLWVGMAAIALVGAAWQLAPLKDAGDRLESLPLKGVGYEGEDLQIQPWERKELEGAGLLKRKYTVGGREFFITVLDGTESRESIHNPYDCFERGGWTILEETDLPLKNGTASLLKIRKNDEEREALFWFSTGTSQHNSPNRYWGQTTLRRITFGISGPEPVLIVVQPLGEEPVDWDKFKNDFHALFTI